MNVAVQPLTREVVWQVPSRIAVIDVGSNTVRLVAFDLQGRIPQLIFNEKAFCGLGKSMASSGRLDPDGMEMAIDTIHRYVTLTDQMRVSHLDIVATAAVREASNRDEFAARVTEVTGGRSLRIISGAEEARYAALGVIAAIPEADGIAGDLGGGSLELVGIRKGVVMQGESTPLGTLRLMDAHGNDAVATNKAIDAALVGHDWIKEFARRDFYAVGGTWRAIARLHMAYRKYPLRILHNYEIEREELRRFLRDIKSHVSEAEILAAGISKKRMAMLPVASLILQRVLKLVSPKRIVISGLGLREGILFHHAPDELKLADPLLAFCREMALRRSRFPEHGDDLMRWIDPLFRCESARDKRLRYAVCLLSDIAWSGHPSYRAELAMDQIMLAQVLGTDHPGRAFIGMALFVLNGGSPDNAATERARALLCPQETARARAVGLALRLAQRISGGTKELLGLAHLNATDQEVTLVVQPDGEYMAGESVQRRLDLLAAALGRQSAISIDDGPAAT
ncbi:Ppx/GppA family phosphatase [Emcibacter sp. SYSU 3D8]|uniref:Ppx/GppA family phosphatase n=1 Tax=Emcibacter sp. SYSU 3D8 TaxID=3133969 RepID=UPI0031FF2EA3